MNRILQLFASLLFLVMVGCQKEISFNAPPSSGTDPVTATLQGNVVDENGDPEQGVTVRVGTKTVITDARGYFRIRNASLDKETSLVTAEKTGYFKAFRVFSASAAVNHVKIKLLKKSLAGTVSSSGGGVVSLANGSSINFAANSFAKKSGGAYSGTVNVYAAAIDPTTPDIGETVPGSFLADDRDNKRVILASYGMIAVELESTSGEKLQIASGSTAKLNFQIPSGIQASAPASIALWYVDETTGRWKEEGTAVKNGTIYTGDVKHFTYWNCDVPGPTVNLSATFVNQDGNPLIHAEIVVRPASGWGTAHGYTDSLGQINDPVPANTNLVLEVRAPYPCYNVLYTQNIGPYTADVNLGTITVNNSQYMVTIQGRVVNCNNNPVTHGFAEIEFDNTLRFARTDASGHFSISFTQCGSGPSNCTIIGADSLAQQQGAPVIVPVTIPLTNAGDIVACGTSTLQFLNYAVDGGTPVNLISSNPGDNFSASDTLGTPNHLIHISGYRSPTEHLWLNFQSPGTTGTFPIGDLSIGSFGNVQPITPSTIVLTSFPQPGGYFEASFSAQFKDAMNNNHSISGSLRVKRRY